MFVVLNEGKPSPNETLKIFAKKRRFLALAIQGFSAAGDAGIRNHSSKFVIVINYRAENR
jgi:hypothetical protein